MYIVWDKLTPLTDYAVQRTIEYVRTSLDWVVLSSTCSRIASRDVQMVSCLFCARIQPVNHEVTLISPPKTVAYATLQINASNVHVVKLPPALLVVRAVSTASTHESS